MLRKRQNSAAEPFDVPSTMFAGIDIAARNIWLRRAI
jgi:hypothetical protein